MNFFDLHCDTLYEAVLRDKNMFENDLDISIARGQYFDNWIQCFAVWIPDNIRGLKALHLFERCFKKFNEFKKNCSETTKVIPILTVEGSAVLAGEIQNVEYLRQKGVKIITLTWNGNCEVGDGVGVKNPRGLTQFGKKCISSMEKNNIIVDVSHASEPLFWDVIEFSKKTVIATHSNSKKVCSHDRNLDDMQFTALKNSGGIVGVTFCDVFLKKDGEASFADIVSHVEHFLSLGGENTICIGSDFDGAKIPRNMYGIESIESLYEYFLKHNYNEKILNKIFFGNAYDFLLDIKGI